MSTLASAAQVWCIKLCIPPCDKWPFRLPKREPGQPRRKQTTALMPMAHAGNLGHLLLWWGCRERLQLHALAMWARFFVFFVFCLLQSLLRRTVKSCRKICKQCGVRASKSNRACEKLYCVHECFCPLLYLYCVVLFFFSEKLLKMFVAQVHTMYREAIMSFNVHQLLHSANTVRKMGPLWANSAFTFETGNGQLLLSITAVKGLPLQIVEKAIMYQELEAVLSHELLPADTRKFCSWLLGYSRMKEACYVSGGVMLGSATPRCNLSSEESAALLECLGFHLSAVMVCKWMILAGQLCRSVQYIRAKESNSTVVQCEDEQILMI